MPAPIPTNSALRRFLRLATLQAAGNFVSEHGQHLACHLVNRLGRVGANTLRVT